MKAACYVDRFQLATQETDIPTLGPGDLLLQVYACGVCGTDVRKVRHALVKPPAILGHEVAGEVVDLGKDVRKFKRGDRVVVAHHTPCYVCHYCRHENFSMCRKFKSSNLDPGGFSEFVRVPEGHVEMTAHKIPEGMPYETAIHMEPLACILRNLKRTKLLPGDTVLVIGLGSMGLLTGQMIKRTPANVIGSDLRFDRRQIAQGLGFDLVLDGNDQHHNNKEKILEMTEGRGLDLVVLTAGNATLYGDVVQLVRDGGSVSIFAGLEPGAKVTYDANDLYSREITIYSSYSPSPCELSEALEHLKNKSVDVHILNSKIFRLEEAFMAIEAVASQKILKAIIAPHGVSQGVSAI